MANQPKTTLTHCLPLTSLQLQKQEKGLKFYLRNVIFLSKEEIYVHKKIVLPLSLMNLPSPAKSVQQLLLLVRTKLRSSKGIHLWKTCWELTRIASDTQEFKLFFCLSFFSIGWPLLPKKNIKLWAGSRRNVPGRSKGRQRKVLSLYQEFLLTLSSIRRGFDTTHLAELFQFHPSYVSRPCTAWIVFLHDCLSPFVRWPDSGQVVKDNLPNSFRRYPKTKSIIGCSELFCEKPFRPVAQRTTWSSYKHHNTFKFLVSIMPSGAITFVSKLYGGSISDEAIVRSSRFSDLVQSGDDIMADRWSNIRHLLLPKGATLNIPAFSHGNNLSSKAMNHSRRIAAVRIHVERAIHRMKT